MKTPLAFLLLTASALSAATATWKGSTPGLQDTWNISTNWLGAIPPAGNDAVFPASGSWIGTMQNTDVTLLSLSVLAPGYGFNNALVAGGLNVSSGITVAFAGTGTVTFNTPLRLDASQAWAMNGSRGTIEWNEPVNLNGRTLTVDGTGVQEFAGGLTGTGSITKTGSGRVAFSSAISGTGTVTVQEGTAEFSHTAMSKAVSLAGTGIVTGTGTVASLSGSSGKVRPGGNGTGRLTSTGSVSLGSGVTLEVAIGGLPNGTASDQLKAGGTVILTNPQLAVTLASGYQPQIGQPISILDSTAVVPVSGQFAGLAEGAEFQIGTITFRINYTADAGRDVTLTPVKADPTGAERVWTGEAGNLWSIPGNWAGGVIPQPGDNVQFPSLAAGIKTSVNDLPAGFPLHLIRFTAGGYSVSGNAVMLSDGIVQQAPVDAAPNVCALSLASAPSGATPPVTRLRLQSGGALTVDSIATFHQADAGSVLVLQNDQAAPLLTFAAQTSGAGGIAKHGPGTAVVSRSCGQTGSFRIYAGEVRQQAGTVPAFTFAVDAGAVLELGKPGSGLVIFNPVNLAGTVRAAAGSGQHQLGGGIKMENGVAGTIVTDNDDGLLINSTITGDGGIHFSGTGPVSLAGISPNNYTGTTTVDGITLTCSKPSGIAAIPGSLSVTGPGGKVKTTEAHHIAPGSAVGITGGAEVELQGAHVLGDLTLQQGRLIIGSSFGIGLTGQVNCLAAAQASEITGIINTISGLPVTWTVADGTAPADLIFSGGAGTPAATQQIIHKQGAGTLRFNNTPGSQHHKFTLRLDHGTVEWNDLPDAPGPFGAAIQLNGGHLTGAGQVLAVESLSGGDVSPGGSPGTLFTESLLWDSAVNFHAECSPGGNDSLRSTGSVQCGGARLLLSGTPPPYGETRTLVDNDGADPVNGTFHELPEGSIIQLGTGLVEISYKGGDGNDITFTRVSPPAPEITSQDFTSHLSGGGQAVYFRGVGLPGFSYALEISDNLQTWATAATVTADAITGEIILQWTPPTIPPRRFFRTRAL